MPMKANVLSVYSSSGKQQSAVQPHTHEYWQLEIITRGVVRCGVLGEALQLETGDLLLIPPGWEHEFTYDKPELAWITLKFERETGPSPVWGGRIHGTSFTNKLVASFKTVIHGDAHKEYEKVFINGFLETVLHYVQSDDFHNAEDASHQLLNAITEMVLARNGKGITVNELAEKLSYTRGHLSKRFKDITGENLKAYIDQIRLQKVEELLLYREQSVSDIAEELGFNDIFSFSRFYKRHAGVSPQKFRTKAAAPEVRSTDKGDA